VPDPTPSKTKNLDRYGAAPLEWARAHAVLANGPLGPGAAAFLGTTRPDGRPHAAGIGPVWHDGDLYFSAGPRTRKARNLAERPGCTISLSLEGIDLVLEGEARRVDDVPTLERIAAVYREGGWPAESDGEGFTAPFSAPSAGPPPWHLYRVTIAQIIGVATAEPHGATRWRFG